jgi:3-oxoacyl-[acyl-carrier-protein] synthase-3
MGALRSRISGTGLGIPSKVLSNEDLSRLVETSDEWIRTRTGIRERRMIDRDRGESNSTIAIVAAREALSRAGCSAQDIDFVICATATPDTIMPMSACRIVAALGAKAGSFDLNAACSGFVSSLHMADALIRAGLQKRVLVVGVDVFSSLLNWQDRSTCVLFGDGAGAAVVEACADLDESRDSMILASKLYTLFDHEEHLSIPGGGSRAPMPVDGRVPTHLPYLQMRGKEVFKNATRCMAEAARDVLAQAGVALSDLRWFVPHQANMRIIEMVAKLLGFPLEKTFVNMERWGNTSAATVGICLAEMNRDGLLKRGDLVLMDVFGAGYTYGAMLVRW